MEVPCIVLRKMGEFIIRLWILKSVVLWNRSMVKQDILDLPLALGTL